MSRLTDDERREANLIRRGSASGLEVQAFLLTRPGCAADIARECRERADALVAEAEEARAWAAFYDRLGARIDSEASKPARAA